MKKLLLLLILIPSISFSQKKGKVEFENYTVTLGDDIYKIKRAKNLTNIANKDIDLFGKLTYLEGYADESHKTDVGDRYIQRLKGDLQFFKEKGVEISSYEKELIHYSELNNNYWKQRNDSINFYTDLLRKKTGLKNGLREEPGKTEQEKQKNKELSEGYSKEIEYLNKHLTEYRDKKRVYSVKKDQ